jgi:hypothetical protein
MVRLRDGPHGFGLFRNGHRHVLVRSANVIGRSRLDSLSSTGYVTSPEAWAFIAASRKASSLWASGTRLPGDCQSTRHDELLLWPHTNERAFRTRSFMNGKGLANGQPSIETAEAPGTPQGKTSQESTRRLSFVSVRLNGTPSCHRGSPPFALLFQPRYARACCCVSTR